MKAPLSDTQLVSQNHFFLITTDKIFMKLHIKLWLLKDKNMTLPGKNVNFGKKAEISLKVGAFGVVKRIIPLMCHFWVYMMQHSCLHDSAKTACFVKKNLFLTL